MLRSKGIICTGCAACDSIYKRTSHASQETNRGHRPEATPWDALSLACSWILLVHFILHTVSAYQRLERKPHPLSIHWQGNQASYLLKEEFTTHLLPFINAIICLVFLHDGTHAHNETGMFWCPLHSFDCKNLWQLKIYGWCTVRICIAHNSRKRHSTRTIRFFKKLGTPDLFNVGLLADAQGKDKGWSVFISSYNGKFLQSFKNQGHH